MPTKLTVTRPSDFIEFKKLSILQGIHQRIEEQVRLYPASIALKTKDLEYSYNQLNGYANSIADAILSVCGEKLAQAAILLPNNSELIIAILGTLKARKAYVPLDRNYPVERLRAMFNDAEPSVLLTDDEHMGLAAELAGNGVPIINTSRIERHTDAPNPKIKCDPLDRAYMLYTSGTTGRPKGIVFLHRNLLHTTMCLTNELFFSPSDRVTWLHSPSFGSSVMDIYCSLTNGAALYPWDPKVQGFNGMAEWLIGEKMTTLQWLPSAFRQFMRTVPDSLKFQDIRIAIMAGEPLTIREVDLFRHHFAVGSHLVNQAGTAESYNYYLYRVDHHIPIEDANVAAGYPVSPDRKLLLLDDAHNEVPQGRIGEIAIKSDYMSGGYWRNDLETQAKFIRIGNDDVPVYLTGDLGKIELDGCLIHLGRKDFQFKIRGCRIEPAEIESLLTRAPGIADCACWFAKNRLGEDQLVGYVVPKIPGDFNQSEVENFLGAQLPGYMVPKIYILMDNLPSLPNGKANRRELPNPFDRVNPSVRQHVIKPQFAEERMLDIFSDILQLDNVTPDTDFLDAGGDSLSATVLRHSIHECFGVDIPMEDFFESATPARLSGLVASISSKNQLRELRTEFVTAERESFAESSASTQLDLTTIPGIEKTSTLRRVFSSGHGITARKNLVIIGAGQCGREIFTWATQAIAAGSALRIKGFLDERPAALQGYDYSARVLGDPNTYKVEEEDVFICAIGNPLAKAKCCSPIEQKGGVFINLIHPLANIGLNVELGIGIVMGPFSSITSDVKVGNHISIGALSNVAHDTVLGDWCQISSHCGVNGCATLGIGAFLGSHACILPGIKVGPWAFVGAGSIVVRDVAARVKVFGNPAEPIGRVKSPVYVTE
jgi:sugar O-acyltransferase (sialic acid O-acetyltransferase NeuD family)